MPARKRTFSPDQTLLLFPVDEPAAAVTSFNPSYSIHDDLANFCEFGGKTICEEHRAKDSDPIPVYVNEFWTAGQRQAHSLQEISYRACFKPQLPRFFIQRLTEPDCVVYDPFMGRGTTLLEAALMGRVPWGCDINPLSHRLLRPRLAPPTLEQVKERAVCLPFDLPGDTRQDLLAFYHPDVLRSLVSMRSYFEQEGRDTVDDWIRMVATNRLTGHSAGFFSVYTLPPNQATSVKSQLRINENRDQVPPPRDLPAIISKKSKQLLKDLTDEERKTLAHVSAQTRLVTASCDDTPMLPNNSVDLVVTSPPFLTEVQYHLDNWLRCWFNHMDSQVVKQWQIRKPRDWRLAMTGVFKELGRILKPDGHIAFEVGEVCNGMIKLEDLVIPAAREAGLNPILVMINAQEFTKTSNCWGVDNSSLGTNTNRIVLIKKL